ncbi:hypothetical protein UlMin_004505 [Ulmus minor]
MSGEHLSNSCQRKKKKKKKTIVNRQENRLSTKVGKLLIQNYSLLEKYHFTPFYFSLLIEQISSNFSNIFNKKSINTEMEMAKLFTTLLYDPFYLTLILLLSVFFLFIHNRTSNVQFNFPPSPPKLPIIGNLHQLGTYPHHSLQALAAKYGPLMFLNLGCVKTIVVSSNEIVREITKNHDIVFSNRPRITGAEIFLYGGKNMGFSPYGEYWRQSRRICALQLLSLKRVQSFQVVREEEVKKLVEELRKTCFNGSCINFSEILISTISNIVCRCILGKTYDSKEDHSSSSTLGELSKTAMSQFMEISVGEFFPSLKWVDVLRGFISRLKSTARALDAFYNFVIEEHKAMKKNDGESSLQDFVDVLLQLQEDSQLGIELTQDHLKALLQDMLLAGIETTAIASEWLMTELVRYPRVMKKAQEEVRRVVGQKGRVDTNDISQMEYIKCVIKESLRLHPPTPLLLPRETSESVQIGGYHIPAKTRVLINAWAIQRDPSTWERPDEFLPERFENNPIDFKNQELTEYIPFGFGRRQCPGIAFGMVSIEYLVANILYWFDWKLPGEDTIPEDLDVTEVYGLTVHKKVPLHLVPISYSP